jgi:pimeloyl-ACP methyl ester carboxylesterase
VGSPPVVLVHGVATSHAHNWVAPGWVDVLTDDGRDVAGFELPGHGAAPRLPAAADDTDRLLDFLADRSAPADVVGYSAGARLVLRAAVRRPEAFRRVALLGVGDAVFRPAGGSSAALADLLDGDSEPVEPGARVFWRLAASAGNDRSAVAAYLRRRPQPLTEAELAGVTPPVLVVVGDRDFAAPADRLVAALPDARQTSLRGTDHFGLAGDVRAMAAVTAFLAGSGSE